MTLLKIWNRYINTDVVEGYEFRGSADHGDAVMSVQFHYKTLVFEDIEALALKWWLEQNSIDIVEQSEGRY